jgi:hypothetical protein
MLGRQTPTNILELSLTISIPMAMAKCHRNNIGNRNSKTWSLNPNKI